MQNYITPVSRVENDNGLKFVIFDAPNESNVQHYIKELLAQGVKHVVRVCEPTYSMKSMEEAGIHVHVRFFTHNHFEILSSLWTIFHGSN